MVTRPPSWSLRAVVLPQIADSDPRYVARRAGRKPCAFTGRRRARLCIRKSVRPMDATKVMARPSIIPFFEGTPFAVSLPGRSFVNQLDDQLLHPFSDGVADLSDRL
jgi:hypothetical protein